VEANNKSMNQKYFIGIDLSKGKIDCAVMTSDIHLLLEKVVKNDLDRIKSFINAFIRKQKCKASDLLICCENTGIYCRPLEKACVELGVDLWVENAVKIKRASTDMRGKSDRKDAERIAEYAVRYIDRKVLFLPSSDDVLELRALAKTRETLINNKKGFECQLNEAKSHDPKLFKTLSKMYKPFIKMYTKTIAENDKMMDEVIERNIELKANSDLVQSIPGVGKQVAVQFIIYTNNFQDFTSAKHLACYAGVVPFENESGKLIKRRRVSKMANLKLKSILHMAAMSAVRGKNDLGEYYVRKVSQGKNKMSVINAVRNKLVHRIWAVVERQSAYKIELT
jgi:transposase